MIRILVLCILLVGQIDSSNAQNSIQKDGKDGFIIIEKESNSSLQNESGTSFISLAIKANHITAEEEIFLSYRIKSGSWENWQKVKVGHEVDPFGPFISELLFFESGFSKIEFKSEYNFEIELHFYQPTSSTPLDNNSRSIADSDSTKCPLPPFYTRIDWECPDSTQAPLWPPEHTDVTHIIVHHSAGTNQVSDYPTIVKSIWNYHTYTNGWGDIGYNWMIDAYGTLYEGRAGGNDAQGAHFSCFNENTMGICMLGTFTDVSPTPAAMKTLEKLISWKVCLGSINPSDTSFHDSSGLMIYNISGHRDGNPSNLGCPKGTACPGDSVWYQLPSVRSAVADRIALDDCGSTILVTRDSCSSSYLVQVDTGESCDLWYSGDLIGASSSINADNCSGKSNHTEDQWFHFTASSSNIEMYLDPSHGLDGVIELYDGCGGLMLDCSDNGGGPGGKEKILYSGLSLSQEYFVRVYAYAISQKPKTSSFNICLKTWNSSASTHQLLSKQIQIMPNPASHHVRINNPSQYSCRYLIYDLLGHVLSKGILMANSQIALEVDDWNASLYFIHVESEGFSETYKLLVD